MKTPTWKIATRMILTGELPPEKFPPKKIPTQDNFHPGNFHSENSHPEKLPPGQSHQENSHPGQFPSGKFLPRKIPTQLISTPDNCSPPNLTKFNKIQAISQNFLLANFFSLNLISDEGFKGLLLNFLEAFILCHSYTTDNTLY